MTRSRGFLSRAGSAILFAGALALAVAGPGAAVDSGEEEGGFPIREIPAFAGKDLGGKGPGVPAFAGKDLGEQGGAVPTLGEWRELDLGVADALRDSDSEASFGSFRLSRDGGELRRRVVGAWQRRVRDEPGRAARELHGQWLGGERLREMALSVAGGSAGEDGAGGGSPEVSEWWGNYARGRLTELTDVGVDELLALGEERILERAGFVRNVNLEYRAPLGRRPQSGAAEVLGALRETEDSAWVWQLRGFHEEAGEFGANAGVLYRQVTSAGRPALWGVNAFLDYQGDVAGGFWRTSLGGEFRAGLFDFYANYYLPITDELTHRGETRYSPTGYDVEANVGAPGVDWLAVVLAHYNFEGKSEYGHSDDTGQRFGLRIHPPLSRRFGWEFELEYDNNSDGGGDFGGRFGLQYEIGGDGSWPAGALAAARRPFGGRFNPKDYFYTPARREYAQRIRVAGTPENQNRGRVVSVADGDLFLWSYAEEAGLVTLRRGGSFEMPAGAITLRLVEDAPVGGDVPEARATLELRGRDVLELRRNSAMVLRDFGRSAELVSGGIALASGAGAEGRQIVSIVAAHSAGDVSVELLVVSQYSRGTALTMFQSDAPPTLRFALREGRVSVRGPSGAGLPGRLSCVLLDARAVSADGSFGTECFGDARAFPPPGTGALTVKRVDDETGREEVDMILRGDDDPANIPLMEQARFETPQLGSGQSVTIFILGDSPEEEGIRVTVIFSAPTLGMLNDLGRTTPQRDIRILGTTGTVEARAGGERVEVSCGGVVSDFIAGFPISCPTALAGLLRDLILRADSGSTGPITTLDPRIRGEVSFVPDEGVFRGGLDNDAIQILPTEPLRPGATYAADVGVAPSGAELNDDNTFALTLIVGDNVSNRDAVFRAAAPNWVGDLHTLFAETSSTLEYSVARPDGGSADGVSFRESGRDGVLILDGNLPASASDGAADDGDAHTGISHLYDARAGIAGQGADYRQSARATLFVLSDSVRRFGVTLNAAGALFTVTGADRDRFADAALAVLEPVCFPPSGPIDQPPIVCPPGTPEPVDEPLSVEFPSPNVAVIHATAALDVDGAVYRATLAATDAGFYGTLAMAVEISVSPPRALRASEILSADQRNITRSAAAGFAGTVHMYTPQSAIDAFAIRTPLGNDAFDVEDGRNLLLTAALDGARQELTMTATARAGHPDPGSGSILLTAAVNRLSPAAGPLRGVATSGERSAQSGAGFGRLARPPGFSGAGYAFVSSSPAGLTVDARGNVSADRDLTPDNQAPRTYVLVAGATDSGFLGTYPVTAEVVVSPAEADAGDALPVRSLGTVAAAGFSGGGGYAIRVNAPFSATFPGVSGDAGFDVNANSGAITFPAINAGDAPKVGTITVSITRPNFLPTSARFVVTLSVLRATPLTVVELDENDSRVEVGQTILNLRDADAALAGATFTRVGGDSLNVLAGGEVQPSARLTPSNQSYRVTARAESSRFLGTQLVTAHVNVSDRTQIALSHQIADADFSRAVTVLENYSDVVYELSPQDPSRVKLLEVPRDAFPLAGRNRVLIPSLRDNDSVLSFRLGLFLTQDRSFTVTIIQRARFDSAAEGGGLRQDVARELTLDLILLATADAVEINRKESDDADTLAGGTLHNFGTGAFAGADFVKTSGDDALRITSDGVVRAVSNLLRNRSYDLVAHATGGFKGRAPFRFRVNVSRPDRLPIVNLGIPPEELDVTVYVAPNYGRGTGAEVHSAAPANDIVNLLLNRGGAGSATGDAAEFSVSQSGNRLRFSLRDARRNDTTRITIVQPVLQTVNDDYLSLVSTVRVAVEGLGDAQRIRTTVAELDADQDNNRQFDPGTDGFLVSLYVSPVHDPNVTIYNLSVGALNLAPTLALVGSALSARAPLLRDDDATRQTFEVRALNGEFLGVMTVTADVTVDRPGGRFLIPGQVIPTPMANVRAAVGYFGDLYTVTLSPGHLIDTNSRSPFSNNRRVLDDDGNWIAVVLLASPGSPVSGFRLETGDLDLGCTPQQETEIGRECQWPGGRSLMEVGVVVTVDAVEDPGQPIAEHDYLDPIPNIRIVRPTNVPSGGTFAKRNPAANPEFEVSGDFIRVAGGVTPGAGRHIIPLEFASPGNGVDEPAGIAGGGFLGTLFFNVTVDIRKLPITDAQAFPLENDEVAVAPNYTGSVYFIAPASPSVSIASIPLIGNARGEIAGRGMRVILPDVLGSGDRRIADFQNIVLTRDGDVNYENRRERLRLVMRGLTVQVQQLSDPAPLAVNVDLKEVDGAYATGATFTRIGGDSELVLSADGVITHASGPGLERRAGNPYLLTVEVTGNFAGVVTLGFSADADNRVAVPNDHSIPDDMRNIVASSVVAQGYTGPLEFYKPVSLNVTLVLPETAVPPFKFPLSATIGQEGFTLSIVDARATEFDNLRAEIDLNIIATSDIHRRTPFVLNYQITVARETTVDQRNIPFNRATVTAPPQTPEALSGIGGCNPYASAGVLNGEDGTGGEAVQKVQDAFQVDGTSGSIAINFADEASAPDAGEYLFNINCTNPRMLGTVTLHIPISVAPISIPDERKIPESVLTQAESLYVSRDFTGAFLTVSPPAEFHSFIEYTDGGGRGDMAATTRLDVAKDGESLVFSVDANTPNNDDEFIRSRVEVVLSGAPNYIQESQRVVVTVAGIETPDVIEAAVGTDEDIAAPLALATLREVDDGVAERNFFTNATFAVQSSGHDGLEVTPEGVVQITDAGMVQDAAETLELTAHASNGSEYLGEVEFVFRLTVTASGLRNDEGIPADIRSARAVVVPEVAPGYSGELTTFALQSRATDPGSHVVNIAVTPSSHNGVVLAQTGRNVVITLQEEYSNTGVKTGTFTVTESIDSRFEPRTTEGLRIAVTVLTTPGPLEDEISADDMDTIDPNNVRMNFAGIDPARYGSGVGAVFGRVDSESQAGLVVNADGGVRIADASAMRAATNLATYTLKATVTSSAFLGAMTLSYRVTVTQTNIRDDEGIPAAIRSPGQFNFVAPPTFTGRITSFTLGGDRVNITGLPTTQNRVAMSQSGREVVFEQQPPGISGSNQVSRFNQSGLNERIDAKFHNRPVELTIDIRRMDTTRERVLLTIPPESVNLPTNDNIYDFKTKDAALASASGFAELAGSESTELDVTDAGIVSTQIELAQGVYLITATVSQEGAFLGIATLTMSLTVHRNSPVPSGDSIDTGDRIQTRVVIPGYSGSVVAYAAGHAEVTLHSPASAPAGFNVDTNAQRTNQAPLVVSMQADLDSGTRSATMTITATRSGRRLTPIELTLTVTAVGPPTQTDPDVIGTNQEVSGDISFTEPTDTIGGINVGGGTFANLQVTRIDTPGGANVNSLVPANNGVGGGVSGAINQPGEYRLEVDYTDPDLIGTLPLTLMVTVQDIFPLTRQSAFDPAVPETAIELYAPVGYQGDLYTLIAAMEVLIDGRSSTGGTGVNIAEAPPSSGVREVTIRASTNSAFQSSGARRASTFQIDFICDPAGTLVCDPEELENAEVIIGANPVVAPDQPTVTVGAGGASSRQAFVRPTESASFATGGALQTVMHDPDDVLINFLDDDIVVQALTAGEHDIEIGFTHPGMLGTLVVEMTIEALATMAVFYNKALYSPALPITVDDADHPIAPSADRDALVQYLGVRRGLTMVLVLGDNDEELFGPALESQNLSRFDNLRAFCSMGGDGWRLPNLAEVAGLLDDVSGTAGGFTRRTAQIYIPGAQNSGPVNSVVYALTYGGSVSNSDAVVPADAAASPAGIIADLAIESGNTRVDRLAIGRTSASGGRPTFGSTARGVRMICVKPGGSYTQPTDPAGVRVAGVDELPDGDGMLTVTLSVPARISSGTYGTVTLESYRYPKSASETGTYVSPVADNDITYTEEGEGVSMIEVNSENAPGRKVVALRPTNYNHTDPVLSTLTVKPAVGRTVAILAVMPVPASPSPPVSRPIAFATWRVGDADVVREFCSEAGGVLSEVVSEDGAKENGEESGDRIVAYQCAFPGARKDQTCVGTIPAASDIPPQSPPRCDELFDTACRSPNPLSESCALP